jgi:hypothetical protein
VKQAIFGLLAGAALIAATPPAPGRGDPDTGIDPPIGAAARAKHGIEPLARPSDDLGMAEDPAGGALVQPAQPPVPPKTPVSATK